MLSIPRSALTSVDCITNSKYFKEIVETNSRNSKLGLLLTGNLLLITRISSGKIMAQSEMPALGSTTMTGAYFLMPVNFSEVYQ